MAKRKQVKQGGDAKKAQKVVRKDEDEDEEEVDADVSSDGEASSEAESSGKEEENDGLADMMSKILNQNTGSKVPVLAKRKTALMKDIEVVHKDSADMKKLRAERRIERTKQMVTPDAATADFERQLKKLATRGVVALFNAIAKAKRETVAAEEAVTSKKAAVVSAHHDDNGSVLSRETSSSSMRGNSKAAGAAGKREKEASAAAAEEEGSKNKQWAALRDDYMVGQKLTVKHWDKAAESDSE